MLSSLDRRSLSLRMGEPLFHVSESLSHFSTNNPSNPLVPSAVPCYAKLLSPRGCPHPPISYHIRKLQVSLGRSVGPAAEDVDIHLGDTKSISRKHARIQYNFETGCFEIAILGSNGLWINDEYCPREAQPIPLLHRTKIDISDVCFYFLLPVIDPVAVISSRVPLPPPDGDEEEDEDDDEDNIPFASSSSSLPKTLRKRSGATARQRNSNVTSSVASKGKETAAPKEPTKQQQHSPASSKASASGSTSRRIEKLASTSSSRSRRRSVEPEPSEPVVKRPRLSLGMPKKPPSPSASDADAAVPSSKKSLSPKGGSQKKQWQIWTPGEKGMVNVTDSPPTATTTTSPPNGTTVTTTRPAPATKTSTRSSVSKRAVSFSTITTRRRSAPEEKPEVPTPPEPQDDGIVYGDEESPFFDPSESTPSVETPPTPPPKKSPGRTPAAATSDGPRRPLRIIPGRTIREGITEPPFTVSELIYTSLCAVPERKMTLQQLNDHVLSRFPRCSSEFPRWKNAVRYHLTLNNVFKNVPRNDQLSPHKNRGGYWAINETAEKSSLIKPDQNTELAELDSTNVAAAGGEFCDGTPASDLSMDAAVERMDIEHDGTAEPFGENGGEVEGNAGTEEGSGMVEGGENTGEVEEQAGTEDEQVGTEDCSGEFEAAENSKEGVFENGVVEPEVDELVEEDTRMEEAGAVVEDAEAEVAEFGAGEVAKEFMIGVVSSETTGFAGPGEEEAGNEQTVSVKETDALPLDPERRDEEFWDSWEK
ncbi:hypothetical protein BJ742DRAFT_181395 [Cladochytrium replicatum]|nr:hypothetical protein BJ742DRAFT_181395 [Cladochytrium replicatum]